MRSLKVDVKCSATLCQTGKTKCASLFGDQCLVFNEALGQNKALKTLRCAKCVQAEQDYNAWVPHFEMISLESIQHPIFELKKATPLVVVCFSEKEYLVTWPFVGFPVTAIGITVETAINAFRDSLVALAFGLFDKDFKLLEPRIRKWQRVLKQTLRKKTASK